MKTRQKTNKFAYKMQRENNFLRGIIKQLTDRCRGVEATAAAAIEQREHWEKSANIWRKIAEDWEKISNVKNEKNV